jgi:hypothetical protein
LHKEVTMLAPRRLIAAVAATSLMCVWAIALDEDPAPPPPIPDRAPTAPRDELRHEVDDLLRELRELRRELAEVRLALSEAQREAAELRQFVLDYEEYGRAYEEYRGVREVAEREQRRRAAEESRARREAEESARLARLQQARALRQDYRRELAEVRRFRDAGFTPIGLDVYVGPTTYHYGPSDGPTYFDPWFGFWHPYQIEARPHLDFSSMTVSGTIMNAAEDVRHIGVAFAFFDRRGQQVGHEVVEVRNARPNVPYPFTSTVTMALDRPFSSATSYVLYADLIEQEE